MKHVTIADFGLAKNRDVTDEAGSGAESNLAFQKTERADFDIRGELDLIA
jgi:hypothetical protein